MKQLKIAIFCLLMVLMPLHAEKYSVDTTHSQVGFKIKHLGLSTVPGHFSSYEASINWNPKNLRKSSFKGIIEVKSIDTANKKRDEHLISPDFFNAKKYPHITFESTRIKKSRKKGHYQVEGILKIKDKQRPVKATLEVLGPVQGPWGKERVGFKTNFKLNRDDYGITWSKVLETGGLVVSKELDVVLDLQAIKN